MPKYQILMMFRAIGPSFSSPRISRRSPFSGFVRLVSQAVVGVEELVQGRHTDHTDNRGKVGVGLAGSGGWKTVNAVTSEVEESLDHDDTWDKGHISKVGAPVTPGIPGIGLRIKGNILSRTVDIIRHTAFSSSSGMPLKAVVSSKENRIFLVERDRGGTKLRRSRVGLQAGVLHDRVNSVPLDRHFVAGGMIRCVALLVVFSDFQFLEPIVMGKLVFSVVVNSTAVAFSLLDDRVLPAA